MLEFKDLMALEFGRFETVMQPPVLLVASVSISALVV
jgi:hypothetical protein